MGNPLPTGFRNTSLPLPPNLAAYVDQQAQRFGISKAGFVRLVLTRAYEADMAGNTSAPTSPAA